MSSGLVELAASLLGDLTRELVIVAAPASTCGSRTRRAARPQHRRRRRDLRRPRQTAYYGLGERLRQHGFAEAIDDPVICRWRHADSGLTLDVMPTDEAILGFSNPWYPLALATAVDWRLPSGVPIRAAAPPLVLATKLAAWDGRGRGERVRSRDVHDIIVLADGRPELADELGNQPEDLRAYVLDRLGELIQHRTSTASLRARSTVTAGSRASAPQRHACDASK